MQEATTDHECLNSQFVTTRIWAALYSMLPQDGSSHATPGTPIITILKEKIRRAPDND